MRLKLRKDSTAYQDCFEFSMVQRFRIRGIMPKVKNYLHYRSLLQSNRIIPILYRHVCGLGRYRRIVFTNQCGDERIVYQAENASYEATVRLGFFQQASGFDTAVTERFVSPPTYSRMFIWGGDV